MQTRLCSFVERHRWHRPLELLANIKCSRDCGVACESVCSYARCHVIRVWPRMSVRSSWHWSCWRYGSFSSLYMYSVHTITFVNLGNFSSIFWLPSIFTSSFVTYVSLALFTGSQFDIKCQILYNNRSKMLFVKGNMPNRVFAIPSFSIN